MFRTSPRGILLALLLACSVLFGSGAAGCRASNPVAIAATAAPDNRAETIAYALVSSFVVIDAQAAAIAGDSTTPVAVSRALVQAHDRASPAVRQLREVAEQYNQVRAAVAAGTSPPEKLGQALLELNRVLPIAAAMIDSLAGAVRGVS